MSELKFTLSSIWKNRRHIIKVIRGMGKDVSDSRLISRYGNEDKDVNQSVIRIGITVLFVFYFSILFFTNNNSGWWKEDLTEVILTIGSYGLLSVIYLIYVLTKPGNFSTRRYTMIILDQVVCSLVLYFTSGSAVIFFSLYVWASLGSGMRFGRRYMLVAVAASALGFLAATWGSKYWHESLDIGLGILLGLIFIPLQVLKLQRKLEVVNAKLYLQAAELVLSATHDKLTGLPNRSLFYDRLSQGMARTQRSEGHLALLFFDLDKFKEVNDTLGHNVGDKILMEVACRIQQHVRTSDTFSRHGGDEFIMILNDIKDINDCTRMADIILKEVASIKEMDGHEINISSSIGIAVYPSKEMHNDPDALVNQADQAMYDAKKKGRNCYCIDPTLVIA